MDWIRQLNKTINYIFIFIILIAGSSYGQNSFLDENIIKNFTYYIELADKKVILKNGQYESGASLKDVTKVDS